MTQPRGDQRLVGRPFAAWLAGATASTLGDAVIYFALGWTASGFGPHATGVVMTAEAVPAFALVLAGGVLADGWGIRRTMLACNAVMLLTMLVTCVVSGSAGISLTGLLVLGVVLGAADAVYRPASAVFPRLLVPEAQLTRALATTSACLQVARLAGPAVAGVLLATGGFTLTAALDAVTFGVVLLVLLRVRPNRSERDGGARASRRPVRAVAEAITVARRTPPVPMLLLAVCGMAATVIPTVAMLVPLAGRERGWHAAETGLVSSGWLVGTLAVTLVVARWGTGERMPLILGPPVGATGLLLVAVTESALLAMAGCAVLGVGCALFTTRALPLALAAAPQGMLARFQALLTVAQTGPVLLATPSSGLVVAAAGVGPTLTGAAVVLAAVAWPAALAGRAVRAQSIA